MINESACLWTSSAPASPVRASLNGALRVPVAVVGAGLMGLSAAFHAAEAGSDVVLLEQHEPGSGVSGRDLGLVTPGLRVSADRVLRRLGREMGEAALALSAGAPDEVFQLIERCRIECQAVQGGWAALGASRAGLRRAARWAKSWQAGPQASPLNKGEAALLTGSARYVGGVLDARGGALHPLKLVHELARAAEARGVRIFTRTRVMRVSRAHYGWFLEADQGSVAARQVILATGANSGGLWPGLERACGVTYRLLAATHPLEARLRETILRNAAGVTEADLRPRSLRWDAEGRLVVEIGAPHMARPALARRLARAFFAEAYPELREVELACAWTVAEAAAPDGLPHLHELAPALIAATGAGPHGISMAVVLGRLLAGWATGTPRERLGYPVTRMRPMEFPELAVARRFLGSYVHF